MCIGDDEPGPGDEPRSEPDHGTATERLHLHRAGLPRRSGRPHRLLRARRHRRRGDPVARTDEHLRKPLIVEQRGDPAEDIRRRRQRLIEHPDNCGTSDLLGQDWDRALRQHTRQQPHRQQEAGPTYTHTRGPVHPGGTAAIHDPAQSHASRDADHLAEHQADRQHAERHDPRPGPGPAHDQSGDPRCRPRSGEQAERKTGEPPDLQHGPPPPAAEQSDDEQQRQRHVEHVRCAAHLHPALAVGRHRPCLRCRRCPPAQLPHRVSETAGWSRSTAGRGGGS